MDGSELAYDPGNTILEQFYIRILGAPIHGLRIRIRRILPQIPGTPETILDAGCGRGVFTLLMAKKFSNATVCGIDIDEDRLERNREIAKQTNISNACFEAQDVSAISYKNRFDIVLSVDNLEHIEDDQKALACLARAIRENGKLILHVPAHERRWFFFKFRKNFSVPGHFRPGYTLEEIVSKVSKTDLRVIEVYHTFGFLENLSNNFSYLVTKAEAKNKIIYALLFPFLNILAWVGRNARPKKGAGVFLIAEKQSCSVNPSEITQHPEITGKDTI